MTAPQRFDPTQPFAAHRATSNAQFERDYCSWLLARHNGNISAAAREARMDRKHLAELAKKHGLR